MANLNPLTSGDVPYPQYSVTTTQEIEPGITILKGVIYTKNAAGNLVVNTSDLVKGIFQARETPTVNVPAIAGDAVQVLGPRSRILMQATGNLVEGDDVDNLPNSNRVIFVAGTDDDEYIGRVFEIYTKDEATGSKKKVAVTDDFVIIETVGP